MRSSFDVEQLIVYVMMAAIGLIPVLVALWTGRVFSTEATVGLLMLVCGIAGVGALVRAAWRESHDRR